MNLARSFSRNPIGFILGALFLLSVIGYFIKGFFLNCVFLDEKYPTRRACIQGEILWAFQHSVEDKAERMTERMENHLEHLQQSIPQNATNSWAQTNVSTR